MRMYCEECGTAMHWRCTDNITNVSKFKCPNCGHVQTGKLKRVEVSKHEPKYYCQKNGRWVVRKVTNYQTLYVGCFADEETAKRVVDSMKKANWDENVIPDVFRSLGIHKYSKVCA